MIVKSNIPHFIVGLKQFKYFWILIFKNSNIQCLKRFSNGNSGLKEKTSKLVEFIERTPLLC